MIMTWQNSFNEESFCSDLELLLVDLVNDLECKVEKLKKSNYFWELKSSLSFHK